MRRKLTADMQTEIVRMLACFYGTGEIVAAVRERFEVDISAQLVEKYDPTKRNGKSVGKRWRKMFDSTRERFLNDISAVPIANKAYRLRMLDRMAIQMRERGNIAMMLKLVEQARVEMDGVKFGDGLHIHLHGDDARL